MKRVFAIQTFLQAACASPILIASCGRTAFPTSMSYNSILSWVISSFLGRYELCIHRNRNIISSKTDFLTENWALFIKTISNHRLLSMSRIIFQDTKSTYLFDLWPNHNFISEKWTALLNYTQLGMPKPSLHIST